MSELYVGLISGTSIDGVDAVIADFAVKPCRIVQARTTQYPEPLRNRVRALIDTPKTALDELGGLDVALGRFFAQCALELIEAAELQPADIRAIGHHGQTIYHRPYGEEPFTLQIGDPNSIAALTDIDTIADFRRLDMAYGGQGAPMVPKFHDWLFRSSDEIRVIVNIGGIANLTILDPDRPITGFDTGPGNTLMDNWINRCTGTDYDDGGRWAASGTIDQALLDELLCEPYLDLEPPKSTGRELFNMGWLEQRMRTRGAHASDADIQATLAEFTAATIARAVHRFSRATRLIVCGGGAYNGDLLERLRRLTGRPVESSEAHGIAPDWVEAGAFAWLAWARLNDIPGNAPSVTGARQAAVLGSVYSGGTRAAAAFEPDEGRGHSQSKTTRLLHQP